MRLVTFHHANSLRPGVLRDDEIIDLSPVCDALAEPAELLSLIRQWAKAEATVRDLLMNGAAAAPLSEVTLATPIPQPPRNVMCLGRNYRAHIVEGAKFRKEDEQKPEPQYPVFFTKAHNAIVGPDASLFYDAELSTQMDYEVELAVVLGRTGVNIGRENVFDYVFGYTILNDVTARDVQYRHTQWFKGKSLDRSCPIGPWIVTKDEIADPNNLDIELRVNGEVRQRSNTRHMIFDIATSLEVLSRGMTMEPGDIFATGTPEGVAMGWDPPRWLQPGDVVECEIAGIGVLRNTVGSSD